MFGVGGCAPNPYLRAKTRSDEAHLLQAQAALDRAGAHRLPPFLTGVWRVGGRIRWVRPVGQCPKETPPSPVNTDLCQSLWQDSRTRSDCHPQLELQTGSADVLRVNGRSVRARRSTHGSALKASRGATFLTL